MSPNIQGGLLMNQKAIKTVKKLLKTKKVSKKKQLKSNELTPKELRFVELYYLAGYSQYSAYMEAFGTKNYGTASVEACKLLKKPKISAYIQKKLAKTEKKFNISLDRILHEMSRIAFSNVFDYLTLQADGTFKYNMLNITRDQAAAIQEFSSNDGEVTLKFYDKKSALLDIGRHLGGFKNTVKVEDGSFADELSKARKRMSQVISGD